MTSFRRILPLVAAFAAAGPLESAEPGPPVTPAPPGFAYVKTVRSISEYRLEANGLQVLLMPERTAPVVTFMVTYLVGSRNEVYGTTGATHLLEHLMFKGSERFNQSRGTGYDQTLAPLGAQNNATTWFDRTNYYVNSPSEHLPIIVELEADRMRNLLLREQDRRVEMTVVRNEFERGENDPFNVLFDQVSSVAFIAHPYHHPTIGWRSDIEGVSIERLREFYDTFYWPNNATVSVIGDFDSAAVLRLIERHYGAIPSSPDDIPQVYTVEPEQDGPRRLVVRRAGQLGVVDIAHKICAGTHPDYAPLTVLSTILATGKNSRLYRTLTDPGLSTGVSAFPFFNHDPTLHHTLIPLAPGATHEQVEAIALDEIEKLEREGVTEDEVSAAINQLVARMAYRRDGSFAIAGTLNEHIAVGDWTTYYTLEDATRAVTADDVRRVARLYFLQDHSTTGWFVPASAASAGEEAENGPMPATGP